MAEKITRNNLIVAVIVTLASLFFRSWPKTVGIAIGAAIMTLNFMAYGHLGRIMIESGKVDKKVIFTYLLKVFVLFALVFLVMIWPWVSKLFFIIGILAIIASFIISFVFQKREGT